MPKSKEELSKMHWRDRYEYEAHREGIRIDTLSEQKLIEKIEKRNIDRYFQIWRTIGKKGTVKNSAMVLWEFLQQSPGKANMLNRYHCTAALFNILDMADPASESELRKQVQWDHGGEEKRQEALLILRGIIEDRLKSDE